MVTAKVALEMLAGFPQTPKSFSRHLRGSRKRQKVLRDACGSSANAKKFFEALAEVPQTPKSSPRHLRKFRKGQKVLRDACGSSANAKKFLETLAEVPQTPKSSPRHLRKFRKHNKSPTRAFTRLCRGFFLKVGQILSLCNPPTPEGPPYRGTPYTSMLTSRSPYARNRP